MKELCTTEAPRFTKKQKHLLWRIRSLEEKKKKKVVCTIQFQTPKQFYWYKVEYKKPVKYLQHIKNRTRNLTLKGLRVNFWTKTRKRTVFKQENFFF